MNSSRAVKRHNRRRAAGVIMRPKQLPISKASHEPRTFAHIRRTYLAQLLRGKVRYVPILERSRSARIARRTRRWCRRRSAARRNQRQRKKKAQRIKPHLHVAPERTRRIRASLVSLASSQGEGVPLPLPVLAPASSLLKGEMQSPLQAVAPLQAPKRSRNLLLHSARFRQFRRLPAGPSSFFAFDCGARAVR